ncbi:cationic amino acid transporter 2-like [Hydractinia symbiolongicarpus]|uniref:cationic amino acid transporter 2-like n=1 Tax=Hydractinia symbiolongicarpus TaxID=13093 RepID=UPI00254AE73B|nr:cationic amino acid transporter 2-like [Hydractinia symbiolongicarpus]
MGLSDLTNTWFGIVFRRKKILRRSAVQQGFSKCLSTHQLIHLGIGATLGAGTYVVTGQVAANMAGPAVVISFTIAAVTSILSGLCYAEFGARVPQTTGSAYTYSYVTVGEIWAFFIGWNLILEYMIGTAADAAALSGSFDYVIGYQIKNWTLENIGTFNTEYLGGYPDILSFIVTIIVTIVLAFGVRESAHFTVAFNIFNIVVIIFIIVTGLFYVDINNWTSGAGFFPYGASGVLSGAATCFYAFVGFDIIATTGEEAKNPSKSIPIAIIASLVIIFLCYFGVSAVITLIMPFDQLDKLSPIPAAFAQRGLSWARYVISIGAICGLSSSLLGNLFPLPRIIFAMAQDGLLFSMFKQMSSRTLVPVNATIYPGILTAVFALLFDLAELVEMMSIGTLLAYTLVSLCVLILRYQPDEYFRDDHQMQPLIEAQSGSETEELADEESLERTSSTVNVPKRSEETTEEETLFNESHLKTPPRLETIYSPKKLPETACDDKSEEENKPSRLDREKHDKREPTEVTGRIVTCACLTLFLWFFGFNSTLLYAFDQIYAKEMWAILLLIFFGLLMIISIGLIYTMPQSSKRFGFMAPCVPALPILAIYANTFLMLKLSKITWIRFGVWMVLGTGIYLFYGTCHSKADNEVTREERT